MRANLPERARIPLANHARMGHVERAAMAFGAGRKMRARGVGVGRGAPLLEGRLRDRPVESMRAAGVIAILVTGRAKLGAKLGLVGCAHAPGSVIIDIAQHAKAYHRAAVQRRAAFEESREIRLADIDL